jgi:hypothetical protein
MKTSFLLILTMLFNCFALGVAADVFFKTVVRRPLQKRNDAAKIEALLRKMTVEEKVGQMTQLTIDMVTGGNDQTKTVMFKLNRDDFSFINTDNKPTVEAGDFTVMVGDLRGKFTLR